MARSRKKKGPLWIIMDRPQKPQKNRVAKNPAVIKVAPRRRVVFMACPLWVLWFITYSIHQLFGPECWEF